MTHDRESLGPERIKTADLCFRAAHTDGRDVVVRPVFFVDASGAFCDLVWEVVDESEKYRDKD